MKRLFFDISDVVGYARKTSRVSGMQRVQARLVALVAEQAGAERAHCVFSRSRRAAVYECPASGLFADPDFCAGRLLATLGLRSPSAPYEHECRQYLQRWAARSPARLLQSWRLGWLAARHPEQLATLGFTVPDPSSIRPVKTKAIRRIAPADSLVLLGSTWAQPSIRSLAQRTFRGGGDVVTLIHDVLPLTHPEFFTRGNARRFAAFLRESPRFTSRYLCTSDYTREHLGRALAAAGAVINVSCLPLAHEFSGFPRNDRPAQASCPEAEAISRKPFVLCVGTIEVRKNGANLLRAWLRVLDTLGDQAPQLVFAGRRGWKIDAFDGVLAENPRLASAITIFEGASDADLAFLYGRCLFTVFVSLAEGWGLPVGESAWFGRHCVASRAASIPEVCGDLLEYVAPDDVEAMARALIRSITDAEYRESRERLIRNAPLRTWAAVAADLLAILGEPACRLPS